MAEIKNKNILICGAGIAGTTLAFWLKKYGFNPTIIELAPELRTGGYVIDFFGAGMDVAEKMDIIPALEASHINIPEITFVNTHGVRSGGINFLKVRKLLNGRAYSILRSDLASILYGKIENDVEVIFGQSITVILQTEKYVQVTFHDGTMRIFDLLVGADGLHSQVRRLIFGEESTFEKFFGYYAASFTLKNYFIRSELFLNCTLPGKQLSLYTIDRNKLAAFFLFTSKEKLVYYHRDIKVQQSILVNAFKDMEWESPFVLSEMKSANDFYFDPVSQIKLNNWSMGRITLLGDACYCPSLLSGQGSALAMVGAYILAGKLKEALGDYSASYTNYERMFKPFINKKHKLAESFAGSFLPQSNFGLWLRNNFSNMMFMPIISKWFVNKYMTDHLTLKEY